LQKVVIRKPGEAGVLQVRRMVISMTSKITSEGQITLPKEIREKLDVRPGDSLAYEVEGNTVVIRKAVLSIWLAIAPSQRRARNGIRLTITKISMTCDAFQVLAASFSFTGSGAAVKRPAVILSRRPFNAWRQSVFATITGEPNQPRPLDVRIDHPSAG
jgi:AbrB family looped-hinge helix DNA binding protein